MDTDDPPFHGVSYCKRNRAYRTSVTLNGRRFHLWNGCKVWACVARDAACLAFAQYLPAHRRNLELLNAGHIPWSMLPGPAPKNEASFFTRYEAWLRDIIAGNARDPHSDGGHLCDEEMRLCRRLSDIRGFLEKLPPSAPRVTIESLAARVAQLESIVSELQKAHHEA